MAQSSIPKEKQSTLYIASRSVFRCRDDLDSKGGDEVELFMLA